MIAPRLPLQKDSTLIHNSYWISIMNAGRNSFTQNRITHIKMLAELEQWHDVTIITQNVDDLHERAGSTNVIHIHGELKKVTSSLNRLDPKCVMEYPLDVPIKVGDKAADGSQLRPYVVWFGEYLSGMDCCLRPD